MATVARAHPYRTDTRRGGGGGGGVHHQTMSTVVCKYWLAGRCTRNPCRFQHHSPPTQPNSSFRSPSGYGPKIAKISTTRERTTLTKYRQQQQPKEETDLITQDTSNRCLEGSIIKATAGIFDENRVCANWMAGTCIYAEKCRFIHSWVSNKAKTDIDRIAQLKEHRKAVTGIALPPGSNILFTGSRDGTLRAWDTHTGQCIDYINVGAEVGCVISEGCWVFVGVPNAIWAWIIETSQKLSLEGPVGQVHAVVVNHDTLFAACGSGMIIAYKSGPEEMPFKIVATMKGHSKAVLSLAISEYHVFSGSEDFTVRCWHPQTFECIHVLEGHSGAVSSLICWDCYLFSGSLDKTVKVWAGTKDQGIEEIHTCYEEQAVMAFMGMTDAAEKSVLFVSCNDNFVRMYELGKERCLVDRGRLFTKKGVTTISFSGRNVFTGDTSGSVDVWQWLSEPCT